MLRDPFEVPYNNKQPRATICFPEISHEQLPSLLRPDVDNVSSIVPRELNPTIESTVTFHSPVNDPIVLGRTVLRNRRFMSVTRDSIALTVAGMDHQVAHVNSDDDLLTAFRCTQLQSQTNDVHCHEYFGSVSHDRFVGFDESDQKQRVPLQPDLELFNFRGSVVIA